MPEVDAVTGADGTTDDGTIAEDGLGVKLAEGFVRKPVDAPVPMG